MSTPETSLDYGDTDDNPIDVTEEVEVGDLSTQQGGDAIDPAKNVRFEIRKATVRPQQSKDADTWQRKFLSLDLVATEGVDEEGKYRGKHFFQDLLLVANTTDYPELDTDHYKNKARFDTKVFLKAMGFDPAKPPKVNDDFLVGLTGREVVADIKRTEMRSATGETDAKGKAIWKGNGEFKNEIKNFRAAE